MSNTLRYPVLRTEVCHAIMESNEVGAVEAKIRCIADLSDAGCQGRQEPKTMQHSKQVPPTRLSDSFRQSSVTEEYVRVFKFEDSKS